MDRRRATGIVIVMIVLCEAVGCERSWHAPDQSISPRDCFVYNPRALRTEQRSGAWKVTDGDQWMMSFDNETDARNGLALARRYGLMCVIGRHKPTRGVVRPATRRAYVVSFWDEPTGESTTISPEHCTRYEPGRVQATDEGSAGWRVSDGAGLMLTVDAATDAKAAVALARQYTTYCTIGRDDFRKSSGRVDYWK